MVTNKAEREATLKGINADIRALFEENQLTYREAMSVLGKLCDEYLHKGKNFLNDVSIQEVSMAPYLGSD